MGICKLENDEKNKINIIKLYFKLYPYWKENYNSNYTSYNKFTKTCLINIIFIEKFMFINLEKSECEIIMNSLVKKEKALEYIAYSMFYSESGLRNQVNILCKKILIELEKSAANQINNYL